MSLLDQTEYDVEGWRPESGDGVEGRITAISTRQGDYEPYPYLEIVVSNATNQELIGKAVGVHGFHTVLKRELADKSPAVGDNIAIRYFGKVESKSLDSRGKPTKFEKYRVVLDPANPKTVETPDWGQLKEQAEAELPSQEFATESVVNAFPGATPVDTYDDEPF